MRAVEPNGRLTVAEAMAFAQGTVPAEAAGAGGKSAAVAEHAPLGIEQEVGAE
jgi:hypothetical protein